MKISETIEMPVALGRLQTVVEEFMRVSNDPSAEVTFRRVGRESSPIELTCEWDSYSSEDGAADAGEAAKE